MTWNSVKTMEVLLRWGLAPWKELPEGEVVSYERMAWGQVVPVWFTWEVHQFYTEMFEAMVSWLLYIGRLVSKTALYSTHCLVKQARVYYGAMVFAWFRGPREVAFHWPWMGHLLSKLNITTSGAKQHHIASNKYASLLKRPKFKSCQNSDNRNKTRIRGKVIECSQGKPLLRRVSMPPPPPPPQAVT